MKFGSAVRAAHFGTHPSPRIESIVLYNQFLGTIFPYVSKINVFLTRVPKSMKGYPPNSYRNLS